MGVCVKIPIRLWIAVMIFFTTFTNYMLRANMSVSIVAMTQGRNKTVPYCLKDTNYTVPQSTGPKAFDWTASQSGWVLGAYFWGYLFTIMLGGFFSERFGAWHTILWSSAAGGVLTALTPVCANWGSWIGVAVNRFLVGVFGGVAYPACNTLIAKWAPPKEKGKFLAAMMGNTLGTMVTFNLVAVVTTEYGWPWGFYSLVILMGVFCLFFGFLVADSPDKHRWISQAEKKYIMEEQEGHVSKKKKVAPYRKILTSFPFWICVTAQFGNIWGLNLIMTYGPKYLSETVGFELRSSAGLAALPYISRMLTGSLFGTIGDMMRRKGIMTTTKIRKFFILFSHFAPAICMFLIGVAGCNASGVVALLVISQGFNGAVVVSNLINPQDLSPNFAGTVFGIMNFVAMSTGIYVPLITGAVTKAYDFSVKGAGIVYMLGGGVLAFCGLIFILFGTAEVQPWNEIKEEEEDGPESHKLTAQVANSNLDQPE